MPKKYIVAIKLPGVNDDQRFPTPHSNHLLEFASKAGREAFIAEMKAVEPAAEAITTEIP
jgi:hypothetical protein